MPKRLYGKTQRVISRKDAKRQRSKVKSKGKKTPKRLNGKRQERSSGSVRVNLAKAYRRRKYPARFI